MPDTAVNEVRTTLRDDLIAAKAIFLRGDISSAQDACYRATGDLAGGEAAFRTLLSAQTDDRSIGWIGRAFDRAIASAESSS